MRARQLSRTARGQRSAEITAVAYSARGQGTRGPRRAEGALAADGARRWGSCGRQLEDDARGQGSRGGRGRRSRLVLARTELPAPTLSRRRSLRLRQLSRTALSRQTALTRRSWAALEACPRADGGARCPDAAATTLVAAEAAVANGTTVSRIALSRGGHGRRSRMGSR